MEDPSARPTPLLHLVACKNSPMTLEVAKTRLAEGDDPNMREDRDGLTPLHVAAHWDNLAMVHLLLLHGADAARQDDHGRTPMSMAQGETKEFFARMAARSESEQRSIFSRMAHLHLGSRIGKALKGARKKMRRTLGAMLPAARRRRADSACNNPAVLTSTPRPSIGSAATTSSSAYCTANEGNTVGGEADRTIGAARASLIPSVHPSTAPNEPREWQRPPTPPKVEATMEIGWIRELEKERKKVEDEKVTIRKKKEKPKAPADKTKPDKDAERHPSTESGDSEEENGESSPGAAKKQRAPRGLRKRVEEMSEERLRSELRAVGVAAGPIGKGGVRKGYENKLIEGLVVEGDQAKLRRIIDGVDPTPGSKTPTSSKAPAPSSTASATKTPRKADDATSVPQKGVDGQKYSRPLECAIAGRSSLAWQEGAAQALDECIRSYFINKGVSAFCYLLIDPRMLPARATDCTLGQMIDAIFYVGKGTKARPHQHLIDARNARDNAQVRLSDKIARILDIWTTGAGVVSLQLSFDICDEEAFTREAALIDAIGMRNLTNAKAGKYYGHVLHWQLLQKTQLGTLMLKRVWTYVRSDPSAIKPIRPEALPDTLFKPWGGAARKQVTSSAVPSGSPAPPPPGLLNRLRAGR